MLSETELHCRSTSNRIPIGKNPCGNATKAPELVISLTGLSADQCPVRIFSPVSITGHQSAYHPAGQSIAGVGHLSSCPLFHPPEPRPRVNRKAEPSRLLPPVGLKSGWLRRFRATLPQITMNDLLQLSPWPGGTACPDSGPVCARRSHRPRCVGPKRARPLQGQA
jgi:hypothetical protein